MLAVNPRGYVHSPVVAKKTKPSWLWSSSSGSEINLYASWKKRRKKMRKRKANSEANDDENDSVIDEKLAAKNRLFTILEREKNNDHEMDERKQGLFQKGSYLFNSVRSGLNRLKIVAAGGGRSSSNEIVGAAPERSGRDSGMEEVNLNDIEPEVIKTATVGSAASSADSGLGEDSEPDHHGTGPVLISNLRKSSSNSSSNSTSVIVNKHTKKHVIIREPSLSKLPSSARKSNRCRVVTTRIYPGASRLPSISSTGTVSSQWSRMCQSAYAEVREKISNCDKFTLRLIFFDWKYNNSSSSEVRRDLEALDPDEIAALVHTVYKVLYYDWKSEVDRSPSLVSIVLHCIQRFLVIIVEFANADSLRFSRKFRDLLRTSEMTCYRNLDQCLQKTRRVYMEFWCALLCVPFLENQLINLKNLDELTKLLDEKS